MLSSPPPTLYIEPAIEPEVTPRESDKHWVERLRTLISEARLNLTASQERYKCKFDKRVRKAVTPKIGSYVYLRKEKGGGHQHKLSVRDYGPFEVVGNNNEEQIVLMCCEDHVENVNVNRVVLTARPNEKASEASAEEYSAD